jgi:hypothetical protein
MSQLAETLQLILKTELVSSLATWHQTATRDEVKGLKIIAAVYKHKGAKKFRSKPQTSHSELPTLREIAAERRKKQLQSHYEAEFSGSRPSESKSAVLRLRKLGDLPCSFVLNSVALKFLESWVLLGDDPKYQELALIALRSMAAVVSADSQAISEQKKQFVWNDPTRGFKAHRVDQVAQQLRSKTSGTQRPWIRPQTPLKEDMNFSSTSFSRQDLERRKQALIKGSGSIIAGSAAQFKAVSAYQDTFVTHFVKYQQRPHPDFHTSISLGRLIPIAKVDK